MHSCVFMYDGVCVCVCDCASGCGGVQVGGGGGGKQSPSMLLYDGLKSV